MLLGLLHLLIHGLQVWVHGCNSVLFLEAYAIVAKRSSAELKSCWFRQLPDKRQQFFGFRLAVVPPVGGPDPVERPAQTFKDELP